MPNFTFDQLHLFFNLYLHDVLISYLKYITKFITYVYCIPSMMTYLLIRTLFVKYSDLKRGLSLWRTPLKKTRLELYLNGGSEKCSLKLFK